MESEPSTRVWIHSPRSKRAGLLSEPWFRIGDAEPYRDAARVLVAAETAGLTWVLAADLIGVTTVG